MRSGDYFVNYKALLICCVLGLATTPLQGAYVCKNGQFINAKDLATTTVEEHFQAGLDALKERNWETAHQQFHIVTVSFENSSLAQDARYYLGVATYEIGDLEVANKEFSAYVANNTLSARLEDVYRYKLSIAQKMAGGALCHLLGFETLPKLQTNRSSALEIFDEISSALPNHDLAATAILNKALLLHSEENFSHAIEVYQSAIRRFPGSSFALQAYQGISACYVDEIARQPQNVDAITLAEINLRQVTKDFPQAQEKAHIEAELVSIKEMYVKALYETAQLFERMSHPKAAVLYYHLAELAYPTSSIAPLCKTRKQELSTYADELHIPTS